MKLLRQVKNEYLENNDQFYDKVYENTYFIYEQVVKRVKNCEVLYLIYL